jgi:hypothetical protein
MPPPTQPTPPVSSIDEQAKAVVEQVKNSLETEQITTEEAQVIRQKAAAVLGEQHPEIQRMDRVILDYSRMANLPSGMADGIRMAQEAQKAAEESAVLPGAPLEELDEMTAPDLFEPPTTLLPSAILTEIPHVDVTGVATKETSGPEDLIRSSEGDTGAEQAGISEKDREIFDSLPVDTEGGFLGKALKNGIDSLNPIDREALFGSLFTDYKKENHPVYLTEWKRRFEESSSQTEKSEEKNQTGGEWDQSSVATALQLKKPVPPEIIARYPDIAKQFGVKTPAKQKPLKPAKPRKAVAAITEETPLPYYTFFRRNRYFLPLVQKIRKGQDLAGGSDSRWNSFVQLFNEAMNNGEIP